MKTVSNASVFPDVWVEHDEPPRSWQRTTTAGRPYGIHRRQAEVPGAEICVPEWLVLPLARTAAVADVERDVQGAVSRALDEVAPTETDFPSPTTIGHGMRFARLLPTRLPVPEVSVFPRGEIAFEWHRDASHVVTVLVDKDGSVHYAALFGQGKVHGSEPLGEVFPAAIEVMVQRAIRAEPSRARATGAA